MDGKIYFEETDIDGKEGKLGSMVCNVAAGTLVVVYFPTLAISVAFIQTAIQKVLSFLIKFSRYFRPLSSYLQNPIHALAISGVIRSFKSTLASTNNSFAGHLGHPQPLPDFCFVYYVLLFLSDFLDGKLH